VPTTGVRDEDPLIALFLSVYEGRSWAGDRSHKEYPERVRDGAVEVIARQVTTGRTLAIEHTLIEPFVGEKTDLHRQFQRFWTGLRVNDSLYEQGVALYVEAPVNVLPHGSNWQGIVADTCAWLRVNKQGFTVHPEVHDCPSKHHPDGKIPLRVRRQPLERTKEGFVIVQRYGELRVGDSVRRALEKKLPKLIRTAVDCRILMLERDQGFVYAETVLQEIDRSRLQFAELARVDEIWIADTASFDTKKEYVDFQRYENASMVESFTFFRGELESMSKNNLPIPREWWPV